MAADALRYRVEGMDCASCAAKIETALGRIDGVSEVSVNFAAETLAFRLEGTTPEEVERKIRSLGYRPRNVTATGRHGQGEDGEAGAPWWRTRKGTLAIGIGVALAAAWITAAVAENPGISRWAFIAAAVMGVVPFVRRALALALSGSPFSIETLMLVAALGAIGIGAAEEAAVVVFLFAVGELLENIAASRARSGIKALADLVPRTAQVVRDGTQVGIAADQLVVGDIVVVRPGDRVPSDGEVVEGSSAVDESPITGESVPVAKEVGSAVFAGSINANGTLRVKVTSTAADNTIARIVHLVEEAQASKAPTARFIERFSAWYTPGAMAVAALVIVAPPLAVGADWDTWIYRGLAVLLIACPCALVISTPAAIASGLAAGARRGLLIKGGAPLEALGHVKTVAFDKTGTLTMGRPRVTDVVSLGAAEDELLALAAAVEKGSAHPLGIAIIAEAEARGVAIPETRASTAIPGKAVAAQFRDGIVAVGSPRHAAEIGALPDETRRQTEHLEADGKTVVVVTRNGTVLGLIAMRDEPRNDAAKGVHSLHALDVRTIMLTGDNCRTGAAIGRILGLEVEAELLPDSKLQSIARLKANGAVAMVGDGINDAPALAAATVGVAMGSGTDVAIETADAALLNSRVTGIADLIGLSRATLSNIHQNIALALGLKAIFLATTMLGVSSLWMAILADTGATVLVTANAVRLLKWRP